MLQSALFPKTLREAPRDADDPSTALLLRGGFIHKLMAGSYTYQPLGWRVLKKIEEIIRAEMDSVGGQELFMPALHPKELWDRSGRWSKLAGDMYQFKDPADRELGLAMTHEELIVDLLGSQSISYQDFPIKLYQFQTKFRHEPRAKSGLLRAREFIMKDLYSAHVSEADMDEYYEKVKASYERIFAAVDVPAIATLASGGAFTTNFTHEFQSISDVGEDTIYVCPEKDYAVNKEIVEKTGTACPTHKVELQEHRAVEVGNIFKLGTKFSLDMDVNYIDESGKAQPIWLASYGIGLGRLMGMVVEHHHDKTGIIWPESIAPYSVHLLDITKTPEEQQKAKDVYQKLTEAGVDVLFDDRPVSAGVKFSDADLLGIPVRLVVSSKTLATDSVEVKRRDSSDMRLVSVEDVASSLTSELPT